MSGMTLLYGIVASMLLPYDFIFLKIRAKTYAYMLHVT
jgi:hypothetical protein